MVFVTASGPFLHLCVNNINVLSHFCDLRLTSDLQEQAEEEREEEVCLPGLSTQLLLRGKSLSESQVVSPQTHKDNCFHAPESFWQSLQMQGGLRRSAQSKGWAGEESWQEEIPQKKLGNNTNARITKPGSAAELGQSSSGHSAAGRQNPEAKVTVHASQRFCLLKKPERPCHTAAGKLSQSHMSAELHDVEAKQGESQALLACMLPSISDWETHKYAEL